MTEVPLSLAGLQSCGARFAAQEWADHQVDCEPCGEVPF